MLKFVPVVLAVALYATSAAAGDWETEKVKCQNKFCPASTASCAAAWAAIAKCTALHATHASEATIDRVIREVNTAAFNSPMSRDRIAEVKGKLAE